MELYTKPEFLWFIAGYVVIMLILGWWYGRKAKGSADFIVGGKTMGALVVFGTMLATWCGGGAIYGGGNSLSYNNGFWPGMWFALIAPIGCLIMYIIAPKVREIMGDKNIFTTAGLIQQKYGKTTGTIVSIAIILAYVAIASYAFRGFGYILNIATGLDLKIGIIISAVICIALACMGGLKSVAPTDAWSILLIMLGLCISVPFAINTAGGWSQVVANTPDYHFDLFGNKGLVPMIGLMTPTIMLMLGDQLQYQRIIGASSMKTYKKSNLMMILGSFLIYPPIAILATVSRSVFPSIEAGAATVASSLLVPTVIGGVLVAAAGAITITTADSCLLSCSTNFTYDIIRQYFKKDMTGKQAVSITRVVCVILGILATAMILLWPDILAIQMWAYTIYGAAVTPAILGALFWKKVTRKAGTASVLVGLVVSIALEIKNPFGVDLSLIAIPISAIVLIVVGLLDKEGQKNVAEVQTVELED